MPQHHLAILGRPKKFGSYAAAAWAPRCLVRVAMPALPACYKRGPANRQIINKRLAESRERLGLVVGFFVKVLRRNKIFVRVYCIESIIALHSKIARSKNFSP